MKLCGVLECSVECWSALWSAGVLCGVLVSYEMFSELSLSNDVESLLQRLFVLVNHHNFVHSIYIFYIIARPSLSFNAVK